MRTQQWMIPITQNTAMEDTENTAMDDTENTAVHVHDAWMSLRMAEQRMKLRE